MKDFITEILEEKYSGKEYDTSLLVGQLMGNFNEIEVKSNGSIAKVISMEPDGDSYLYTFEIETEDEKHVLVQAHVVFEFPYNAEMPVGYERLYIREDEDEKYEIVVVMQNKRMNVLGIEKRPQPDLTKMPRYDLSNGAEDVIISVKQDKSYWEQKRRELEAIKRQEEQMQQIASGHISSDITTVLGITSQMGITATPTVSMVNKTSLTDYKGKKLVTDNESERNYLQQSHHGGHRMILIDTPRTICSCCGSDLVVETHDIIKCRNCNSIIGKVFNKTRNLVKSYFENNEEEE